MGHPDFETLRARVEAHDLDVVSDAVTFSEKLRRATGWSRATAARAIQEYKRFIILAVVAGHKVSPSKAVDEVWHLHLTDTRRYWDEFCPVVLGRPLHHEPSRGGAIEDEMLAHQYRQTLASYERLFGEAPPRDIWPVGPTWIERTRRALAASQTFFGSRGARAAAATCAPLLLVGCALVDSSRPGAIQGPDFVWLFAGLSIVAFLLMAILQRVLGAPRALNVNEADLGSYELAYLSGGATRLFATALLRLSQAGHIVIGGDQGASISGRTAKQVRAAVRLGTPLPAGSPNLDQEIVEAVRMNALNGPQSVSVAITELRDRLRKSGLAPDTRQRRRVWLIALVLIGALLTLGAVRLSFGVANHRAVAFLFIEMVVVLLGSLILSAANAARVGPAARRLLQQARASTRLAQPSRKGEVAPPPADPVLSYAIWGVAAVASIDFVAFRHAMRVYAPPSGGDSGGTAGGGCSGAGGCGGGGGCGG